MEEASKLIDEYIAKLTDWRHDTYSEVRRMIREADPEIVEEWKWMGSAVWNRNGNICLANAFKNKVKVTFASGASLPDPDHVFNAGLDGKKWRSIDLFKGDKLNEASFKSLVKAAVELNLAKKKAPSRRKKTEA